MVSLSLTTLFITTDLVADNGRHPIHLHGHQPQIITKSENVFPSTSPHKYPTSNDTIVSDGNEAIPPRRDTWQLAANGQTRIRFRADNPGVWFLHCHMEWHMSAGLLATIVEAPLELQKNQPTIPAEMAAICKSQGIGTSGNAAGNTQNYTDVKGAPTMPFAAPWGANIR